MVSVDHPCPEDAEEDNEGDELVDGPEDVAGDVGDTLLNIIVKFSDNSVTSDSTVANQTGLNCVILLVNVLFSKVSQMMIFTCRRPPTHVEL